MLERLRWPTGPICPHCGVIDEATRMESREGSETQLRDGVYNRRACRKPFSVTVGTIFEGSHIPLAKWLVGFYLFASSKRGISALQLQRQLALGSNRTAWHMAHRIRHAMQNDPKRPLLSGIVEVDETFVGGKIRRGAVGGRKGFAKASAAAKAWQGMRTPVAVLVWRDGQARARAIDKVTGDNIKAFLAANVDATKAALHADEEKSYKAPGLEFAGGHRAVNHVRGEYARGSGNAIPRVQRAVQALDPRRVAPHQPRAHRPLPR